MIDTDDQDQLFMLISDNIEEDIECIAFGGTAMMYYNYKNSTKDIDLFFKTSKEREVFIKAIKKLGYKKKNFLKSIYFKKKAVHKNAPLMFARGDEERFDLFSGEIFKTRITNEILQRARQVRDFNGKNQLRIKVISPEDLVLLKSVTSRERDIEDIKTIIVNTENFNWETLIKEAIRQSELGDNWVKLDLEDKMNKLKDKILIKKKYFDMLYDIE